MIHINIFPAGPLGLKSLQFVENLDTDGNIKGSVEWALYPESESNTIYFNSSLPGYSFNQAVSV